MVGIILLTREDHYLVQGRLPKRPIDDKAILVEFCKEAIIVCTKNTADTLPTSIRKVANNILVNPQDIAEYECSKRVVNLGIKTLYEYPCDTLFVVRSPEESYTLGKNTKKFDLSGYERITTVFTSLVTQIDIYRVRY